MSKNMKKHFTALVLIAVFLTAIPLMTIRINIPKSANKKNSAQEPVKLTDMLAYEFKEGYCEEGLKATGIILNSNYKAGEKVNTLSKTEFFKKYKNEKNYYSLIEKLSEELKDQCITYKEKAVKIPYYYITNGDCKTDLPYIKSTANPWDLLSAKYNFDAKSGVSLNSINEMCRKGLSCEDALNRYFENIKITAVKD